MREILFRGKRKLGNEWIEGSLHTEKFTDDEEYLCCEVCQCDVYPETVGQYTGLTDKNGKKIFEGDILKCKHEWHNWNTSFRNDEEDFIEQKIRGAYGKYIDKTLDGLFKCRYYYFRNYAVEYYAPNGGFRIRNGGQFKGLTKNRILNGNLEIIGNIHDNPELLKGGTE